MTETIYEKKLLNVSIFLSLIHDPSSNNEEAGFVTRVYDLFMTSLWPLLQPATSPKSVLSEAWQIGFSSLLLIDFCIDGLNSAVQRLKNVPLSFGSIEHWKYFLLNEWIYFLCWGAYLMCLIFYLSCPDCYGSADNDEVNLERMNKDYNR